MVRADVKEVLSYQYLRSTYNLTHILVEFCQSCFYRALDWVLMLQEAEVPRILDIRHMKVARLSALHTGRLYLPEEVPGTHFS